MNIADSERKALSEWASATTPQKRCTRRFLTMLEWFQMDICSWTLPHIYNARWAVMTVLVVAVGPI
jgi:hypothetical protein